MEIQEASPPRGAETRPKPVSPEVVHQLFTTNIYGPVGNVSAGSTGVTQHATVNVLRGDFGSLAAYLRSQGVREEEIQELKEAVADEPPKRHPKRFGRRVVAWIDRTKTRLAAELPAAVVADLLVKALMAFYGHT